MPASRREQASTKIGDLSRRSGLSAHTLRYSERIGLVPDADRDVSGRRDYDASILTWIAFLGRLKATGMSISAMLRYASLRAQGRSTEPERCALLERHRRQVRQRIADFQSCLLVLDTKIAGYAGVGEKKTDDASTRLEREPLRTRATDSH